MLQKILTFVMVGFLGLTLSSCSGGNGEDGDNGGSSFWKTDLEAFDLKGDIEWMEERTKVWITENPISSEGFYYRFTEGGYKLQQKRFGRNNSVMGVTTFAHNEVGMPVSSVTKNESGETLSTGTFEWDEEARRMKYTMKSGISSDVYMTTEQLFDEKANIIHEKHINAAGEMMEETKYKYDENGRVLVEERLEGDGHLEFKQTNKYDDKGNLVEAYRVDAHSGDWTNTFEYEFDDQGNWKIRRTLLNGEKVEESERTYKYRQ